MGAVKNRQVSAVESASLSVLYDFLNDFITAVGVEKSGGFVDPKMLEFVGNQQVGYENEDMRQQFVEMAFFVQDFNENWNFEEYLERKAY